MKTLESGRDWTPLDAMSKTSQALDVGSIPIARSKYEGPSRRVSVKASGAGTTIASPAYCAARSTSVLIPAMFCSSVSGTPWRAPRYSGVL